MKKLVGISVAALCASVGQGAEVMLDDFQSYDTGFEFAAVRSANTNANFSVNGADGWFAAPGSYTSEATNGRISVEEVPNSQGNKALFIFGNYPRVWNKVPVDENPVYTFRVYSDNLANNNVFGVGPDVTADGYIPGYGDMSALVRVQGNGIDYHDGATYQAGGLVPNMQLNTWYDITITPDNVNKTSNMTVTGGGFTNTVENISFRNTNLENLPLDTFYSIAGKPDANGIYFDYGIYTPPPPIPDLPVNIETGITNEGFGLSWSNQTEKVYTIEMKENLALDSDWTAVTSGVSSVDEVLTINLPTDSANTAFYRVITVDPEK